MEPGLMALYGVLADAYKQLGGSEAYLKAERTAWGPIVGEAQYGEVQRRK